MTNLMAIGLTSWVLARVRELSTFNLLKMSTGIAALAGNPGIYFMGRCGGFQGKV
ncbi:MULTISPECIES: hypothetical protein [Lactobacillaceae]|uniref:hypothetical protein n=1 Tax=Lactobacillaceae TaxID=33958 RepID=UPI0014578B4E|nr:hypothetical protein [Lactobacillus sp. HBUAS51381]NLR08603.1 hypothetical protein [Lactobacillus sp. HBUAS51381]